MKPGFIVDQNCFSEKWTAVSRRNWLVVLAVFLLAVFVVGLEARLPEGADEPRIAGIGAEMAVTGKYLLPHLNGKPFLETPPLFYWATALSMKIFGCNVFAAKLAAALSAVAGALAVFLILQKMRYSNFTAFIGASMLATSLPYWGNGRKCMTDIMLAAFIALAMYAFYALTQSERLRGRCGWFLFFALSLAGALMSKAIIGLGIPCSALFFWLLLDNILVRRKITWQFWIMLFGGALLSLLPFAVWLYLVYGNYGYDVAHTILWTNNIGRFLGSHAEHVEPFYYYFEKIPAQFQPWAILAWAGAIYHIHKVWKRRAGSSNSIFMLCWVLIPYLALMISSGKRNVYALPLYGGEALLAASFVSAMLSLATAKKWLEHKSVNVSFRVAGWLLIAATPILFLVGLLAASGLQFHIYMIWGPLFCIAAVILWRSAGFTRRGMGLLCAFAGIYVTADTYLTTLNDKQESYRNIFTQARVRMENDGTERLYLLAHSERVQGAAFFYLGRTVPCIDEDALVEILKEPGEAFFIANKPYSGLEATGVENVRVQLYRTKKSK